MSRKKNVRKQKARLALLGQIRKLRAEGRTWRDTFRSIDRSHKGLFPSMQTLQAWACKHGVVTEPSKGKRPISEDVGKQRVQRALWLDYVTKMREAGRSWGVIHKDVDSKALGLFPSQNAVQVWWSRETRRLKEKPPKPPIQKVEEEKPLSPLAQALYDKAFNESWKDAFQGMDEAYSAQFAELGRKGEELEARIESHTEQLGRLVTRNGSFGMNEVVEVIQEAVHQNTVTAEAGFELIRLFLGEMES